MRRRKSRSSCNGSTCRLDQSSSQATRGGVGLQDVIQSLHGACTDVLQHLVNDRSNARKVQAPLEKRLNCDLVGRVQQRWGATAGPCGGSSEFDGRETPVVRRLEVELTDDRQVEGLYTGCDALRPGERLRDRCSHIGRAQLREQRTVRILYERMYHALWMHDDLDTRLGQAKQQRRLDDLEPLVHQSRRIDRYLA